MSEGQCTDCINIIPANDVNGACLDQEIFSHRAHIEPMTSSTSDQFPVTTVPSNG